MKKLWFTRLFGVSLAFLLVFASAGCDSVGEDEEELIVEDIVVGPPSVAEEGLSVTVHYAGWLENGDQFDSSYSRGEPFEFVLGRGQVIEGWDKGLVGMRVGGKRKLIIPPDMAYGNRGGGCSASGDCVIPPNATLVFEVELLEVQEP